MDSRYRKFLALAEAGSFSAAARRLHVTQPAISLAIASLEHGLGARLYVRRSRPVVLTHEGRIVADAARDMLSIMETMQSALDDGRPKKKHQVGLIDSIAHLMYAADSERPPLTGFEVMVDNSRQILSDLLGGKIDLGVITGQPATLDSGIAVRELHNEEFVFVAAPGHVPPHQANQIDDWLAVNRESTTYRHFIQVFQEQSLHITPICHSTSMELLKDMAVSGKGTALLPLHIVRDALKDGTLQIVSSPRLYRPIWMVTRRPDSTHTLEAFAFARQVDTLLAAV